jgi:hypothetical protein
MRSRLDETSLLRSSDGFQMKRCDEQGNPPILICGKCRRPMDYLATLPAIVNLPAVYAYRCLPCLRVDTIVLGSPRRAPRLIHTHDRQ